MKPMIADGVWRATLETKGGPLPFLLAIEHPLTDDRPAGIAARIISADEEQEIPLVEWQGDDLVFRIDYYDAEIRARVAPDGRSMTGEFSRRRGADQWVRMPFQASMQPLHLHPKWSTPDAPQRYSVRFDGETDPAVLIVGPTGAVNSNRRAIKATFLTTTGDYRYLEGSYDGSWANGDFSLQLSTFNGVHAFLFKATQSPDRATLRGDFYSGPTGHTTWTATPDAEASLPDAFAMAEVADDVRIDDLAYTALDGSRVRLGDPALGGGARARILYVFGTWCPNCKDATAALGDMLTRWAPKGLAVTGLAFEVTGDTARDLRQIGIYRERSGAAFPIVLAGTTNKEQRARAFPVLREIKAFPTLIFLDARSKVRAVYTGFSGPAAPAENAAMLRRFDTIIGRMLLDPADIGDPMPRHDGR